MRFHSRLGLGLCFLAIAGAPTLLGSQSPAPPSLGAADSFAVLGGSSVTSTGSTIVTGNLGVSPGNTISGSITVKVGATYRNDSVAKQAQRDATSAYNDLAARTCTKDLTGQNLGGLPPLGRGVYCFTSSAQLTGTLILDAANDPNAVWIFKIGTTLATDTGSSVRVINNGYEGNIFWQVGDSVTLNTGTTFVGNVLAHNDITLHAGASISGRLLAQGAVFLDGNNVTLCCGPIIVSPETLPNGTVCMPYTATTFTASGGMALYTFSVASGPLPDGLTLVGGVLSGTPTRQGSFNILITAVDSKGCSGSRSYVIQIGCPPDPPIPLPPVKACEFNCRQILPSCGNGPHVFSVTSGVLPAGLVLSPDDGMLCGTPATPGDYVFDVTDSASGCPRHYTLQVICNIMIAPETLPSATACGPYDETLIASCGTTQYTFSAPPGTLPDGLFLLANGRVFGTPTTPGTSTFAVTVTDAKSCTASRSYTVVVNPQLTILPPTLLNGVVCVPYIEPIAPSCGTPPYACSVVAGALPPGLILTNCTISETPTKAGTFSFTVKATDSPGFSTTRPYTIVITCPKITIDPPVLPPATTCQQFCVKLTPSCAIGKTVFSVAAGAPSPGAVSPGALPPGLILSDDGMLCGTPTAAGDYSWTVTFTDSESGCTGSVTYTLRVTAGLTITPACPPEGTPGVPYSEMFTASGGTAPYTFILNGTLPPGLTFMQTTPTTATISGTPTAPGCFPITITVTDANGCSTSSTCTLCVVAGGPTLTEWGMVVLSILLVGVGFVMIRKGNV